MLEVIDSPEAPELYQSSTRALPELYELNLYFQNFPHMHICTASHFLMCIMCRWIPHQLVDANISVPF